MRLRIRFAAAALAALSMAATPAPPPPVELSTFIVPIRANLGPLLPAIEAQVPKTFADTATERGIDVRYRVERDPIALKMVGAGLHATTTLRYAVETCRDPIGCVSCGKNEPMRKVEIALHSVLSWDANWLLRSTTKGRPADFPSRCRLLGIDITNWQIRPIVEAQLRDVAKSIDANTPKLTNIRRDAQQVWTSLQAPTELAPRTWLVLEPLDVALAPIRGAGHDVTSALTMRARTRVIVGEKPVVVARPLPTLRQAPLAAASAVRVPLDVELSHADASRLMTEQFGKRTHKVNGRNLTIDTIRLLPAAGDKLAIEASIDYRGGTLRNYKGNVILEGKPRFDAATNTIVIDDLDYAIDRSRNPFLRLAERLAHDDVRARLRESARFPIAKELATVRAEIDRALTRPLAPGATLRGRVQSVQPTGVFGTAAGVTVRVIAIGAAEVALK